jgi:ABC-type lipoprotein release transport system permease subunit
LLRAGDRETAGDAFLKAADLNPRHAPTLRRLVRHYLQEGDLDALFEVVAEIEYPYTATDATTFASMAAVLAATAHVASAIPAWRAHRIDPAMTLRAE